MVEQEPRSCEKVQELAGQDASKSNHNQDVPVGIPPLLNPESSRPQNPADLIQDSFPLIEFKDDLDVKNKLYWGPSEWFLAMISVSANSTETITQIDESRGWSYQYEATMQMDESKRWIHQYEGTSFDQLLRSNVPQSQTNGNQNK